MSIKCKIAANCPHDLDTCCGVCGFRQNCGNACDSVYMMKPDACPDSEVITGEITAFQSAVPETIKKITSVIAMKKQLDEQEKQLKQKLVEAMEIYQVKAFENDLIKMVYVAPTTRSTIDSARLKEDHPDIVKEYTKTSKVSASVRVTLKGGK